MEERPLLRHLSTPTVLQLIQQVRFNYYWLAAFSYIFLFPLGNVYIADTGNDVIRKVTMSTGIITTIAGSGSTSFSGDNGPATSAGLCGPSGVGLDVAGTVLN